MNKTLGSLCLLAALATTGCQVGQKALEKDFPSYNETIRNLEDEHMLLNLVRLRYTLTPRWSVQTETGTTQGADVFYNIEFGGN